MDGKGSDAYFLSLAALICSKNLRPTWVVLSGVSPSDLMMKKRVSLCFTGARIIGVRETSVMAQVGVMW